MGGSEVGRVGCGKPVWVAGREAGRMGVLEGGEEVVRCREKTSL